ncbi:MAG: hypothetical protein IKD04_00630 [Clostridia bacterium]|nr:hypothetical protein [Clostridia bacterium]
MNLKIADFNIEYTRSNSLLEKLLGDYISDNGKVDFSISATDSELEAQRIYEGGQISLRMAENNVLHQKIADQLPSRNAFVLHSACFDVEGEGVVFSAHSGTGKTTHMRLWQEYLGDKMVVVNGDKPMVRFFDSEPVTPYAYGTPWNGKERYGCNMRTPLKHICFIERSETNFVEVLDKGAAIDRIFNQVYMPKDPIALACTINLIDRLLSSCKLWIIHCNMDISAAGVAYKAIIAENK